MKSNQSNKSWQVCGEILNLGKSLICGYIYRYTYIFYWFIKDSFYVSTKGIYVTRVTEFPVKVEIFLEQREVAFLSPSKICENLNFIREIYLCSKIISTLLFR